MKKEKFKTGIFDGISHRDYHSMPCVSSTYLERLRECPAKAQVPRTDSPQMAFGRAFHCYVLEGPGEFAKNFVVIDREINLRTKAGKAEYDEIKSSNPGRELVSMDDHQRILDMWDVISSHPCAAPLLMQGKSEQSVFWTDPDTLINCKARPDRVPAGDRGVMVDLKTARSSEQKQFEFECSRLGYYRRAAMYVEGFNLVSSSKVDAFVFIVCESAPPYPVEVFALPEWKLQQGRAEFHGSMELEYRCRQAQHYPPWRYNKIKTLYEFEV